MKPVLLLLLLAVQLSAQDVSPTRAQSGDDVILRERLNQDFYVAGGEIRIEVPVAGDLIAAGGKIVVKDSIREDILVAGGNIIIEGYVGDDIRCAGGTIRLTGSVSGDVIVAGGTVDIDKEAVVHGNLLVSGGDVTVNGEIKGFVKSTSGVFTLNGAVGKDIECRGEEIDINGIVRGNALLVANTITVGEDADFHNEVRYWNKEGTLDVKNTSARFLYDPSLAPEQGKWHYLGFASFLFVLLYLGMALVMVALIQFLFSTTMRSAATIALSQSLKSIGLGLLFFLGVPVAIVLTMVSLVGIPIGLILLFSYITILLLATVITSVVAANWMNNVYFKSQWKHLKIAAIAFLIFVTLKLASLTPLIGPLLLFLLVCLAFGAILQAIPWRKNMVLVKT